MPSDTMISSRNTNSKDVDEDVGVEVAMPPSYWDKWTPGFNAETSSDAPSIVNDDDNVESSSHHAKSPTSIKKISLLALSIAAVSIGGTAFAVNGTKKETIKAVDLSKLHKTDDLDDCEDVRRVLVVPGSENFQTPEEASTKARQMRILQLKGSSEKRKRKCATQYEESDSDKCAKKASKTRTKNAGRKLGQASTILTETSPSRPSPVPTLCREEDDSGEDTTLPGDDSSGGDTLPELPRGEPVPATDPPTPPPRGTSAPTKAVVTEPPTPAPSDKGEEDTVPVTPLPTAVPTAVPTAAPTNEPTPAPTNEPTKETTKPDNDPNDSNEVGFLGFDLIKNNDLNLLVNEGLEVQLIAKKKQQVQFSNGKKSDITYHEWMDGAGVIPLKNGYVYVSNSENDDGTGGVWGLYFNANDEIVGFKKLLGGTTWNCSGGVSPWKTWISCEEVSGTGQCHEVDPDPSSKNHDKPMQTLLGGNGGAFEAVAVDSRGKEPVFFVTEDRQRGALRRVKSSCTGWGALHGTRDGCTLETTYLRLRPGRDPPSFEWTTNKETAMTSASNIFPNSEGIAFHDGKLSFMSKTKKKMFTLDLDAGTYVEERTGLKFRGKGSFNGQPDQTLDDPDSNYMYFTEEDGRGVGVYARHDKDGFYYTIFEDTGARIGDETVGIATSPDGKILFVGFQESGELFTVRRKDGGRF